MGEFSTVPSSSRWYERFLLREEGHLVCRLCMFAREISEEIQNCYARHNRKHNGKHDETHLTNDVSSLRKGKRNERKQ